jgi:hypothetical protein
LDQSKFAFDQAFKLKKRLTEDKGTKRIPIKDTAITQLNTMLDPPSGLVRAIIAITTSDLRNCLRHTTTVIEATELQVTALATGATDPLSPHRRATGIGAIIAHVNAHPLGEKASVTMADLGMRRANTQGMNPVMIGAAVGAKASLAVLLHLAPTCRVFATHFFR